ncbi:hypothetical protein BGZ93_004383 [Podila epicladia]|nr:hypothetical protein BGZ93_004383 [Podila epicladia]
MGHYIHHSVLNPIAFIFHCCLFLVSILSPINAQSPFTPESSYGSGSVYIEGVAFYIQSGNSSSTDSLTQQTFSIDLSVGWNVSSPAYTKLADGISDSWFPNALLNDNFSWVAVSNKTLVAFDLKTGVRSSGAPFAINGSFKGVGAYVDSSTGEFVVPTLTSPSAPNPVYSSRNFNVTAVAEPACTQLGGLRYYAIAWSTSQQAAFAFGGKSAAGNNSATLMRLNRHSSTWSPILAEGGPSARHAACMVAIEGGNRLVVFGGQAEDDVVQYDIYIYDVLTSKWTKGSNGIPRSGHVCAASSGKLIAWGGYSNAAAGASVPVLTAVYDLTTHSWQDQFVPRPSPSSSSNTKTSSTPVATIAGGCAGAIAVLVILVFLMVRRRRRAAMKLDETLLPFQATSPSTDKDALLPEAASYANVTNPAHDPQLRLSKTGTFDSNMSEYRPQAPQGLGPATDSRSPQYVPSPIGFVYHGQQKQQQPEHDRLQQMQLEERLALEQLIETHRVQMETQKGHMEAQNKRLQLLMEQRRAYQAELGQGRGPQATASVEVFDARSPQLT